MDEKGGMMFKPSTQEWLETDGLGGFSSSTTSGIHTRRYHGWLFLSGKDPGERRLVLSKLEDWCEIDGGCFHLSSNFYPGTTHPCSYENQWGFKKAPFPTFLFKLGNVFLEREIFMAHRLPGVFCVYKLKDSASRPVTLKFRPLCNHRFYHYCMNERFWDPVFHSGDGCVVLGTGSYGDTAAVVCHGASFQNEPYWYHNMVYPVERDRGLDYMEDHFSPGIFSTTLHPGEPVVVWAGPTSKDPKKFGMGVFRNNATYIREQNLSLEEFMRCLPDLYMKIRSAEIDRRKKIYEMAGSGIKGRLALAGDQFVVSAGDSSSIIAGYHWFGEWGRDSFIALPGLLLCTGRFKEAREVFRRFTGDMCNGLIPNTFRENKGASYNSVDASLWFVNALAGYYQATGDTAFIREMLQYVKMIIDCFVAGTDYDVGVGQGSLLKAGNEHTQLTWMDATSLGEPVTPRNGYPVEINALWIKALWLYIKWSQNYMGNIPGSYNRLLKEAKTEYIKHFVWQGVGLYDGIRDGKPVCEIRPNQVIALSVGPSVSSRALSNGFSTAMTHLLTPHGLRTLAPSSSKYTGNYSGDEHSRDTSYHQGTAWPWLFGPLFDLSMKVYPGTGGNVLKRVFPMIIERILSLDRNPCIGTIFEVASGDSPYRPGGAVSQAWSVSEALRIVSILKDKGWLEHEFEHIDAGMGVSTRSCGRFG